MAATISRIESALNLLRNDFQFVSAVSKYLDFGTFSKYLLSVPVL
jgi:hypothetical protein